MSSFTGQRSGVSMPAARRPAPHAGKCRFARALTLASRVSATSNGIWRGMHRQSWFQLMGSRRPNSRRWIAPLHFQLRGVAACSERPPPGQHARTGTL